MFNSIQKPRHEQLATDDQLVKHGLKMLDEIFAQTQSEVVGSLRDMCVNLHRDCQRIRTEAITLAKELDFSSYMGNN